MSMPTPSYAQTVVMHQHRRALLIPGAAAGEFAMRIISPWAVERVLSASYWPAERCAPLIEAAAMYRSEYADTGLIGNVDASPGRQCGSAGAAIENLTVEQMQAWRAHNRARAMMPPRCRGEVDDVVLREAEAGVRVPLLIAGLCALAVHYDVA